MTQCSAENIFWLPYQNEDEIFDLPDKSFKLTAKAAVPAGGLREPDSTTMLVYGPDKKTPPEPCHADLLDSGESAADRYRG